MRDERRGFAAPDEDASEEGDELEMSSLRSEQDDQSAPAATRLLLARMRRKLLAWRRPLGAGVALLLIALLVVGFLHPLGVMTTATPVPLSVAERAVYFEYGAGWGNMLLNGQKVDAYSVLSAEEPITLQRGISRIDFSAPPFPPMQCVISAPPARSDTCPLLNHLDVNDPITSPDQGRVVNLGDLISRLSPGQFNALVVATDDALATLAAQGIAGAFFSSVALAAGDHYLDAQGNMMLATAPIKATLSFALQRAGYRQAFDSRYPCKIFCDVWPNPTINAWITARYAYTPLDGNGSASQGALFPANAGFDSSFLLPLEVSWANGWHVSINQYDAIGTTNQFCGIGSVLLTQDITNGGAVSPQQYGVGDAPGCAYTTFIPGISQAPPGTTKASKPSRAIMPSNSLAFFLFRCGVMVAANALAKQLAPALPVASPAEAQAAQQLINGQPYTSGG